MRPSVANFGNVEGKVYDLGSGKKVVELSSGSLKGRKQAGLGRATYVPSFGDIDSRRPNAAPNVIGNCDCILYIIITRSIFRCSKVEFEWRLNDIFEVRKPSRPMRSRD